MTAIVKTFRLGKEVAIVFPPEFGIKPGQKFKIEKTKNVIIPTLIENDIETF